MCSRLHVHKLPSQQVCRSVPCSSVWGREAVMVCRFLLQTRRLPCTLLLRSSKKCSSFEFSQNAITSCSDSSSWTAGETSIFFSSQTFPCRATRSDKFMSAWNETQLSFPIYVSTHTDMSPMMASTVKHSDSLNFHFNLVMEKATRTSLANTFGLNRELLENTRLLADWIHWPVGKC